MNIKMVMTVLAAASMFACVHIAKAGDNNAAAVKHKLAITLDANCCNMMGGMLWVNGDVVSTSTNETIRYSPKLYLEFIDKDGGKDQTVESTWNPDDKELFKVAPGKKGPFVSIQGGGQPKYKFSGKGTVYAYATPEGQSGIDKRISNLVKMEVDFDKGTVRILDVQP